jgi:hypothetical protein
LVRVAIDRHRLFANGAAAVFAVIAAGWASSAWALTCSPGYVAIDYGPPIGLSCTSVLDLPPVGGPTGLDLDAAIEDEIDAAHARDEAAARRGLNRNPITSMMHGEDNPYDDPFLDFTVVHDNGSALSSASGAISGTAPAATITDVGVGTDAFYNGSQMFKLGGDQRLLIGGLVQYDSIDSLSANARTAHAGLYSVAAAAHYYNGSAYLIGAGSLGWGMGSFADGATGITGSFGLHSYALGISGGNRFTLLDTRTDKTPLTDLRVGYAAPGGYALQLDLNGHLLYHNATSDAFVDSAGNAGGAGTTSILTAGSEARLAALVPMGRMTASPYVSAGIDQDVAYSNSATVPAQGGKPGDTLYFGTPQTTFSARMGVSVQDESGFNVGLHAFASTSGQYQAAGAQVALRYVFH